MSDEWTDLAHSACGTVIVQHHGLLPAGDMVRAANLRNTDGTPSVAGSIFYCRACEQTVMLAELATSAASS